MDQRPEQPPEGKLIADAANRLDLSIREAARRAGISYGRWRQITTGYQNVSPGSFAPVHAPAGTLAKMARVVGVTAEQMETAGQRPDAAEILRIDAAAQDAGEDFALPATAAMEIAMRSHLEEMQLRVELARRRNPGRRLTGRLVFPLDARDAGSWDDLLARGWSENDVPRGIAALHTWEQEAARLDEDGSAAGLTAAPEVSTWQQSAHAARKALSAIR
jgi:hypothetical protein